MPRASGNVERLVELVDLSLRGEVPDYFLPWFQVSRRSAEYRAGRFEGAIEWIRKALALDDSPSLRNAEAHLLLAMSHQRLGQKEEAARSMALAEESLAPLPPAGGGVQIDGWHDWLIIQIVHRARELLDGAP